MNPDFYIAERDGAGFEVRTLEDMEKQLQAGYRIIRIRDDTETVIADPETGWLEDKPAISGPKVCVSAATEAVQALDILMNGG